MALLDLWKKDRSQIAEKHIQQVIAFAGDGKLSDDSPASIELRTFLRNVPSDLLSKYIDQCLQESFPNSGFALQDLVNEIGQRLDFSVTPGRYRGTSAHTGHDGIWSEGKKHSIVVEVKTTDAYRIDLNTIARYRQNLAKSEVITFENSSMLVVVGRQDTGDLEAQIRGSRHAWDMRVISVEALLRMLKLKEEVEDPSLLGRIHEILIPMEFTRLDPIVEIAFAAVEDVKQDFKQDPDIDEDTEEKDGKKFTPVSFHSDCIVRIEKRLGIDLVKHSRASFESADEKTKVVCSISRFHERGNRFWFAFHPHQLDFLTKAEHSYVSFGCGDAGTIFLIPFSDFLPWLDFFNRTEKPDRFYWHVKIHRAGENYAITGKAGSKDIDINKYKI
jgi:hypothetical protein